ncbi:MAG TPA: methyltransferase domain-containing protein [Victivallales bacterium]|nr:methyltransferase domain-containing protein [Victivallales bacterium]
MVTITNSNLNINYNEIVELFDETPIWSAPFGLKLLENVNIKKNLIGLDIGFGSGFPLTELAMRLGKTCKFYGIDPLDSAVKRTCKKIDFYRLTNIELIHGMAEIIPLDDNSLDLITSNNGINNVSDLEKVLSECSRILKSGGQFIQTMNLNTTMMEFYDIMKSVLIGLDMDFELNKMQDQIYKKRKPLKEFTSILEQHNFSILNVLHDQFEYKFTDGTTMLNHFFIKLGFLDGWKDIVPTTKQVEIFKLIENQMNEKANREGCFKLSIPFVLIDCKKI